MILIAEPWGGEYKPSLDFQTMGGQAGMINSEMDSKDITLSIITDYYLEHGMKDVTGIQLKILFVELFSLENMDCFQAQNTL